MAITDYMGVGKIQGEEEVFGFLNDITVKKIRQEIEAESLRNKALPVDTTLISIPGLDLKLVQAQKGYAVYGATDISSYEVTVGPLESATVNCYVCYAHALYGFKAAVSSEFKSSQYTAALTSIKRTENKYITTGIEASKANSETPINPAGPFVFDDIMTLYAAVGSNEGSMTHILMHPDAYAELLRDDDMKQTISDVGIQNPRVGTNVQRMKIGVDLIISPWATVKQLVGYDYDRYMVFADAARYKHEEVNLRTAGSGFSEGHLIYGAWGTGARPSASDYVGYMTHT